MARTVSFDEGFWIFADVGTFRYLGRITTLDVARDVRRLPEVIDLEPVYELQVVQVPDPRNPQAPPVLALNGLPYALLGIGAPLTVRWSSYLRVDDLKLPDREEVKKIVNGVEEFKDQIRASRVGLVAGTQRKS
jgi:hypothetical protein